MELKDYTTEELMAELKREMLKKGQRRLQYCDAECASIGVR